MKNTWQEEFRNPTSEYRAMPFWSWNGHLDTEELKQQMDSFEQMGYGGFVIHSRIGLSDEYMGPLFMSCVEFCIDYAKQKNMRVFLYDDDRWPSGYGAGETTRDNPSYKARALLISRKHHPDGYHLTGRRQTSRMTENGVIRLLSAYRVELDEKGFLSEYRRVSGDDGEANLFAYEILTDELAWFNNSAYPDLLNPEATSRFLEVSYERYKEGLGERFGSSAEAIFTDEPQHILFHTLKKAFGEEDLILPYSFDMDRRFRTDMGYSILDRLPEVVWNTEGPVSKTRYDYYRWTTETFADSYSRVLGDWCRQNGILFTGHLLKEESLESLSQCNGDAMIHYRHYDIPGIDILVDRREFQTAKQVQSVKNQYGKKGVICELFGVTNWDFPLRGHLRQANWLMALGTSIRVPHLAWMHMGGEAKRDYPAPLDFHSPWSGRYRIVEDHLARVNLFTSKGKPSVKVAVLNPVESYWAISGPDDQSLERRKRMSENLHKLTDWLLFSQMDFDFISEPLIGDLLHKDRLGQLHFGRMKYDALVVPETYCIRDTTREFIREFAKRNGKVLMLDGSEESDGVLSIGFDHDRLLDELEPLREIRITTENAKAADNIICHLNREGGDAYLFITACSLAEDTTMYSSFRKHVEDPIITVSVKGIHSVFICEGETGQIRKIHSSLNDGWTVFSCVFHDNDSMMAFLKERDGENPAEEMPPVFSDPINIKDVKGISLDEDNVLVLDIPHCYMDGVDYGTEYILRADERFRRTAGYRMRSDAYVQPWVTGNHNPIGHTVRLDYSFLSELDGIPVDLAFEGDAQIAFNGSTVDCSVHSRTYIDRMIRRVSIGYLRKGMNTISLEIPFGPGTDLEACFLLGEFGVRLEGGKTIVCALPSGIGWQSLTNQGLPFYGGNIDYITEVKLESDGRYCVSLPRFNAPIMDVSVDDGEFLPIVREPFRADLGYLEKGMHTIRFRCYGTRINQFGQIHNTEKSRTYWGPGSWRTTGTGWSYSYQLNDTGILAEPVVRLIQGTL